METDGRAVHTTTLRDYLHILRRRKWVVLQVTVLLPVVAVALSLQQQKLYEASAEVLLSSQNLAAQLTGTQSGSANVPPDRIGQTQAEIARVPEIARRVLERVKSSDMTVVRFLDASSVSAVTNSDFLRFSVTDHDPVLARRFVNAYADEYTAYRRQLDTASISRALADVNTTLAQLASHGEQKSALYANLVVHQQTLRSIEVLQTANASVLERAGAVVQTQPKTTRNGIVGLFLGLVFGISLAFLREALDTHVRSAEEIGQRFGGVPLLARLPAPSKRMREDSRLVMLKDSTGLQAEAVRNFRTNVDFVTLGRNIRAIMVVSAVEGEGKSTAVANLAVAAALAGRHVVLVDMDLRRPYIDKFFDLSGPGITQVALGQVTLEEALVPIAMSDGVPSGESRGGDVGTNAGMRGIPKPAKGMLEVLPSGLIPPDPGEFATTKEVTDILAELRERADLVLIDTPPVLRVGDAMALATRVDGIIAVTRMKIVRRHMLTEFARRLMTAPAPLLGVVITDADREEGYGEAYGKGYYEKLHHRSETAPD